MPRWIFVAAILAAVGAQAAEERFVGGRAQEQAGRALNRALGYDYAYDAGAVAVGYIDKFAGSVLTVLRFSPEDGHQVIYVKRGSEHDPATGRICADLRLLHERFTEESQAELFYKKSNVVVRIAQWSLLDGRVCLTGPNDVTVSVTGLLRDQPGDGRPATQMPAGGAGGER